MSGLEKTEPNCQSPVWSRSAISTSLSKIIQIEQSRQSAISALLMSEKTVLTNKKRKGPDPGHAWNYEQESQTKLEQKAKKQKTTRKLQAKSPPVRPAPVVHVPDENWKKLKVLDSNSKATMQKKQPRNEWQRNPRQNTLKVPKYRMKPTEDKNIDLPDSISTEPTKRLALDCEFVGIGAGYRKHMLARVSLVNEFGGVVYDSYVAPQSPVGDYRTHVSGITPQLLSGAPSFEEVQSTVAKLIENRTILGHHLTHDFQVHLIPDQQALKLKHPKTLVRDTARYGPCLRAPKKPKALKTLAREFLGVSIQEGSHSSVAFCHKQVEDARASLLLYKKFAKEWDAEVAKRAKLKKKHHKAKQEARLAKQQASQAKEVTTPS